MCIAVCYRHQGNEIKTYFTNPKATLPIRLKNGEKRSIVWGRRQSEASNLPMGGWAHIDTIRAGDWDGYFARAVKIAATGFIERNVESHPQWFPVTGGQWLQGLLARYDNEYRVYVVTLTPRDLNSAYQRWPRVVADGGMAFV